MDKNGFLQLLKKFRQGKLTKKERDIVEQWYQSYGEGEDIAPLQDKGRVIEIHDQLLKNLERHIDQREQHTSRIIPFKWTLAASILIAFIGLALWRANFGVQPGQQIVAIQEPVYDTIQVDIGKMKRIILPDSSEVWLNANSQLRYERRAFSSKRAVFLDRGEAFFSIQTDPQHPFTVHATDLTTQVLGTSFNVKAYPELPYTAIEVKTGKVKISANVGMLTDTLSAGRGVVYDKRNNSWNVGNLKSKDIGEWVNGRTILHEVTFEELAMVVRNRFQVELKNSSPGSANERYSITILQHKPWEETLRLICTIHHHKYKQHGKTITLFK